MLSKTRAIVIRSVKFSETSLIVSAFTQVHGLQSYIVNSVRVRGDKNRIALFQPLTILDLVVYHKESEGVKRLKSFEVNYAYSQTPYHPQKALLAMFLTEILHKTLTTDCVDDNLYKWVEDSLILLDRSEYFSEFHICFLIQYFSFLGIKPGTAEDLGFEHLTQQQRMELQILLQGGYNESPILISLSKSKVLDQLIGLMRINLEIQDIKSVSVIRQLFV